MIIQIKTIESKEEWSKFVDEYSPHTFLQNWEWKLSQEIMGNKTFSLGIYDDDELIGVAFVYKITARRGSFLFCPHGPLVKEEKDSAYGDFFRYIKDLANQEKVDFIRISPLEIKTDESVKIFKDAGFKDAPLHMHPELAWILNIEPSEEQLLKGMKKRTRYSINKAEKDGVELISSTELKDLDAFYEVYMETANRQEFVPFSKEYIKKEFDIFGKEGKILIFFAKYQNEIIATAMIIYSNGSGFYHHGASTRNHTNITASEFLQWQAIREAKRRGIKLYNFWGVAPESAVNHPWVGLSRFKRGFGGFEEEYVHAQDLPITLKYWLNFAVETIRRIKRKY